MKTNRAVLLGALIAIIINYIFTISFINFYYNSKVDRLNKEQKELEEDISASKSYIFILSELQKRGG